MGAGFHWAVASGKGGTGKTTVAVSLALLLAEQGCAVHYLDCDVEEPNGHIFLKPVIAESFPASIPVPVVDPQKCTACGACAKVCEYNAMAVLKTALVFPELCHGCGGCTLACPAGAIQEQPRPMGVVEQGQAGPLGFIQGRINVGEPMSPPLIRAVIKVAPANGVAILDAPPGTACPVVTTLRAADYVLLVTEPTPFGLNDLRLAVDLTRQLGRPCGIVVNRADAENDAVQAYCQAERLEVLAEIPDDRTVAEAYSRGEMPAQTVPAFRAALHGLADRLVMKLPQRLRP